MVRHSEPPAGFTPRAFDRWLSRGEENLILGNGTAAFELTAEQHKVLERMDLLVGRAYDAIDRADLHVIHCDLWHDNIKLHAGKLLPFDFEDTIWGFRCHDIAMAMLDLKDETGEIK